MNRQFLAGLTVTLLIFCWGDALAQGPRKGQRMHHPSWNKECETLDTLDLSQSQREAIQKIEAQHKGQILECRQAVMVKRIELQNHLRDRDVSEASIRKKSDELEEARRLLQGKMMGYQIDIRRVLLPEQLSRWCTMIGEPFSRKGWTDDSWCR